LNATKTVKAFHSRIFSVTKLPVQGKKRRQRRR